ncbi:MAG: putative sensor protein [Firmicutes bacterium]|nr:putative sensor protein [Bacillota bacterium]
MKKLAVNVSKNGMFNDRCDYCQRFELLNMITDALLLFQANDGKVIFMNQHAMELYGYTLDESDNLSIFSISHASRATILDQKKIAKQYSKGYTYISRHIKKGGTVIKVQVTMKYMLFHGTKIFAAVVRETTADDRFREEIELAGNVQRKLLPQNLENEFVGIRTLYHPHSYVSGDIYDFIFDEEKKELHGTVIDVMGHGLSAASHTNILKYLFHRTIEEGMPLNRGLAWINKEVMSFFHDGNFAAVVLFTLDFTAKTLTYSSAGIHNFIYLSSQGPEVIKCPGLFLGIKNEEFFDLGTIHFQPGDSFFFLTDGFDQLYDQPLSKDLSFTELHTLLKAITTTDKCYDDASGICIVTH